MKKIGELLVQIVFIIGALLIPFAIWYILLKAIFWAFGGTIFGYHFSYKIVVGIILITIIIRFVILSPLTKRNSED